VWAHHFGFVGGGEGRLALQADGPEASGKAVVFSVLGAMAAEAGPGGVTLGDASGWSCTVGLAWETGRAYRLRVWTDEDGGWSAVVADGTTAAKVVGHIRVPGDWRRLASRSMVSTEYRGPAPARCDDLPLSRVVFPMPAADEGTVRPVRHESQVGPGTCEGSFIEDLGNGDVRHQVGGRA
jgi:hypothetical protein